MFAVIKAGGKQYRVIEDQVLKVEGVKGEPGTIVQLGDVIMLGGDKPEIGAPMVSGASVAAEILDHVRGAKPTKGPKPKPEAKAKPAPSDDGDETKAKKKQAKKPAKKPAAKAKAKS